MCLCCLLLEVTAFEVFRRDLDLESDLFHYEFLFRPRFLLAPFVVTDEAELTRVPILLSNVICLVRNVLRLVLPGKVSLPTRGKVFRGASLGVKARRDRRETASITLLDARLPIVVPRQSTFPSFFSIIILDKLILVRDVLVVRGNRLCTLYSVILKLHYIFFFNHIMLL